MNKDTDNIEEALVCSIIATCSTIIHVNSTENNGTRNRKVWCKDYYRERDELGAYKLTLEELRLNDPFSFRQYLRMSAGDFEELLQIVGPHITKQSTHLRKTIPPEEKLAVTLRFLATGNSYQDLSYTFRMHRTTIAGFVPLVCKKIYECLKDLYLKLPDTPEVWKSYAKRTEERWQFPNCIGAADGKHIAILHPEDSGSTHYNYKGFYSIVLLAIVDYDYRFLYVDVGCQGRISDGGVYRNSSFYKALENGSLGLPDSEQLPQSTDPDWSFDQCAVPVPFMFVADDAFPLGMHCMKPFPQANLTDRKRIFNYRLSRVRRISENVFGIWANRFRVFTTTMALEPNKAVDVTLATIVLHNFLRSKSKESYTGQGAVDLENDNGDVVQGDWRKDPENINFMRSLPVTKSNRASLSADRVRNVLADHFYGPGQIPWQWKVLL